MLSSMAQGSLFEQVEDANFATGNVIIRGANGTRGVLCNNGTTCLICAAWKRRREAASSQRVPAFVGPTLIGEDARLLAAVQARAG
jgi:hypothetical protein